MTKDKKLKVEVVKGVYGHMSIYINDYRIAGVKPMAGGEVLYSFTTTEKDIKTALRLE